MAFLSIYWFVNLLESQNCEYDDQDTWKNKVGVSVATEITDGKIISADSVSDYFSYRSFQAVSPDMFESDSSIHGSVLRAENMDNMLESLGLPDMPALSNHQQSVMLKSETHPIGWAVFNRDMGFDRHIVFEIGDDSNHIRLNIKDSWSGDDFKIQIDQITLWDKNMTYSIPCREYDLWVEMAEDIIGTIDLAVQALCNDDDEQACRAFSEVERFKVELLKVVSPQRMQNHITIKPRP